VEVSADQIVDRPSEGAGEGRGWKIFLPLVFLAFLVLAYTYVWAIQPGYGPDETRHFHYIRLLVEKQRLPVLVNAVEQDGAHSLHPPLYYALMTPVYLATRGLGEKEAMRVLKHVSPLLLLGALALYAGMLRRLFPGRPFVVGAALAVVALLPEFQLEAAVINNDSLAVLLSALLLWWLAKTHDRGPCTGTALAAGVIMAAFVNTKATGWTLSPLWAVALALRAMRPDTSGTLTRWLRDLAVGYGVLLLAGTWWYIRNFQIYGQPVPLDFMGGQLSPHNMTTGEPLTPLQVYLTGAIIPYGKRAVEGLFQSFWVQIDWVAETYRPVIFGICLVAMLLAVAGGWSAITTAYRESGKSYRPPATLVPGVGFVLNWLHTFYIATFLHLGFYQGGRYLMPSVFGAGIMLAAGWERLLPRKARLPVAITVAVALIGFNALCLVEIVTVLNPKYVRP
jgi:hypothetical protein